MNRISRIFVLLMAMALVAACGGKKEEHQATTTKKETEKVPAAVRTIVDPDGGRFYHEDILFSPF